MKTVSTKLSKQDFDKFFEVCNAEGLCQSELLRNIVQDYCQDCEDEDKINSVEEINEEHEKILEDKKNTKGGFFKYEEKTTLENEQTKTKTLREFDVKEGRMIENGIDIGSTLNYFLMGGNVWENGQLIGRIKRTS